MQGIVTIRKSGIQRIYMYVAIHLTLVVMWQARSFCVLPVQALSPYMKLYRLQGSHAMADSAIQVYIATCYTIHCCEQLE